MLKYRAGIIAVRAVKYPAKKTGIRTGCPNQEEKHESMGQKPRIAFDHTSASIMPDRYFLFIK